MGKVSLSLGQKRLVESQLKALTNEDTLLRTHGVSWAAQTGKHLLRTQNVSEQNQKHFLCPGHKICVRNKCCLSRQTGKHLCRQQCVGNNVSSFARAFILRMSGSYSVTDSQLSVLRFVHAIN